MIDQTLSQALQKEIPILTAQIRSLYAEFDKKFHLNGAKIPITFGMEPDLLGSYTRGSCHEKEHFHFSLLFIGYAVKNPLKKEDRLDLYKHEYAQFSHSLRVSVAARNPRKRLEILLFPDWCGTNAIL